MFKMKMNSDQESQRNSKSAANKTGTGNSSARNPVYGSNSAGSRSDQHSQIRDEGGQSSQRTSSGGGHSQVSQPQRGSMARNLGSTRRSTGIIDPEGSRQRSQLGKNASRPRGEGQSNANEGQRFPIGHVNESSRVPVDNGSSGQYTRPSTRREAQRSHLQQQGKRGRPIQTQTDQNQRTRYGQNSLESSGNYDPHPHSQTVEENHSVRHEVQYRQQDIQFEKLSSFTVRTRQVYLIPKNLPCRCLGIETRKPLPCRNEDIGIWWKLFRCLLMVVLLLLCCLLFFATYHLFMILMDKYNAYKAKYSGFECGSAGPGRGCG